MKNEEFYQDKTNMSGSEDIKSVEKEELMPIKSSSRLFSVIALLFSLLSVVFCTSGIGIGIAFGIIAAVFSVLSRIKLGYFDKISLGALVIGVFGISLSLAFFISALFN